MRYFGGKTRLARELAAIINRYDVRSYHEPFCGMFSVGALVMAPQRSAADIQPDLIQLLTSVRDGWIGPKSVSEAEYEQLKAATPSALRGFAGFGCSNSGKFFGGYAREATGRNFAANARSSLEKLRPKIAGVSFVVQDYRAYDGGADLIYCDPPYAETTGYTVGAFDTNEFWAWVQSVSKKSLVLVSEYAAPDWASTIWEKQVRTDMNGKTGNKLQRTEKLFCVGSYREQ